MEILTADEMRAVDRHAIETLGIPGRTLMENAGRAVASAWLRDEPALAPGPGDAPTPWILCGKGHNGGDGLVAARRLREEGWRPRVVLVADPDDLPPDVAAILAEARGAGVEVAVVTDARGWASHARALERSTPVLDALLGTGVEGAAREPIATVIRDVVASRATVTSVDLPSGLDADTGEVAGDAIRARRSYALCRPKRCTYLRPAREYGGDWRVLEIGIPREAVDALATPPLRRLDPEGVRGRLPSLAPDAHKGTRGRLTVVAGSVGRAGAAALTGLGALRAGAGLVTVVTSRAARIEVATLVPELMTSEFPGADDGLPCDAWAIGPGLGTDAESVERVARLTAGHAGPMVIDADGLTALALRGRTLERPRNSATVLTPHPGEAARLLDVPTEEIGRDRPAAVDRLVERYGAVVALKGEFTLVGAPDGRRFLNPSGNPGMATAGTGDVLTGVVGALLALGLDAVDAACVAVRVHGDAGDLAARRIGPVGYLATDVADALPRARARLETP